MHVVDSNYTIGEQGMKLTDTFVKNRKGNGAVQKHTDGGGLYLYITPEGAKSWRLGYRFMNRQKILVIGPYPTIGLKEARERREAAKKMLLDNIDPSTAKQEAKAIAANAAKSSFHIIALEWLNKYSINWTKAYRGHILRRLEKYVFPSLGKRPIKSITAPELLEALRRAEDKGAGFMAHQALSECGRIFRYAIATGRAERDIAADLRGALTPKRSKHFAAITEPQSIGRLLCSLEEYNGTFTLRCALRLSPLVFVRPNELALAEWKEINFDSNEWRIPGVRMKMRQTHTVPLAPQAVSILHELHKLSGQGRYVFPARGNTDNDTPMNRVSLVRALRIAGYSKEEMTQHGFRAMASTMLNELGYNRDWIERQLAHGDRNGVRAAYNYAEYLPERRRMMEEWANYLDTLRDKARQHKQEPGKR